MEIIVAIGVCVLVIGLSTLVKKLCRKVLKKLERE